MERAFFFTFVVVAAASAASIAGCARGAGTGDGGGVALMDSGMPPPPGFDAGPPPPGFDAGPPPPGFDAGPPPPGFDAGGGSCSESPCRLVSPQCGCSAGQGCYLSGATRVCGTPGPEAEGQACSGATACQAGMLCIGTAASGFCSRFCGTDADCPGGAGSLCLLELDDGTGAAIPGVRLCTADCDPAAPGVGCPASMGCAIFEESMGAGRVFTGCRPAGTAGEGDPCVMDECGPGLFCGSGTCYRWCTYPLGSECTGFTFCEPFGTPAVVGSVEYGYCL